MIDRWILGGRGSTWDVITVAGALTQSLASIGVVLDLESGRPLPVAVRELTTLDHLSKSELVVLIEIDPSSTPSRIEEAVQVLRAMWTNEVTTLLGEHWNLDEAPNRPQPLHCETLRLLLVVSEANADLQQLATELQVELIEAGSSPEDERERWIWMDDRAIAELLAEQERFVGGRSTS